MKTNKAKAVKKIPMRRCAGCMESRPKKELIRIAAYEGQIALDPTGKAKGRGVYLCPCDECLSKARKRKSLQRSLDMELSEEQLEQLFWELKNYEKQ